MQVIDSRFVPALDDWVEEHVFRGPIWDFSREGPVVHLVAEGGEKNASGSIRHPDEWPARSKATDVISALLRRAGAEASDLRIPKLKATLPRTVTVGVKVGKPPKDGKKDNRKTVQRLKVKNEDTYWHEAEQIADSIDKDLYADNHGKLVLTGKKARPEFRIEAVVAAGPGDGEARRRRRAHQPVARPWPGPEGPQEGRARPGPTP